jgi:hypothetical protein
VARQDQLGRRWSSRVWGEQLGDEENQLLAGREDGEEAEQAGGGADRWRRVREAQDAAGFSQYLATARASLDDKVPVTISRSSPDADDSADDVLMRQLCPGNRRTRYMVLGTCRYLNSVHGTCGRQSLLPLSALLCRSHFARTATAPGHLPDDDGKWFFRSGPSSLLPSSPGLFNPST